jgi:hypothetical protein
LPWALRTRIDETDASEREKGFRTMTPRPRWHRLLSEISKWDDRFERELVPWIELAAGLVALTVLAASLLAASDGT